MKVPLRTCTARTGKTASTENLTHVHFLFPWLYNNKENILRALYHLLNRDGVTCRPSYIQSLETLRYKRFIKLGLWLS